MIARGEIILVDTMVIIEAFRTNCWKAVAGGFRLHTVEKCCIEAATGDKLKAGYVAVDDAELRRTATVLSVSDAQLAILTVTLSEPDRIQEGEQHLLAHSIYKPLPWFVCSPEFAVMKAGRELGMLDRFVSLETLASMVGMSPKLRFNYTEKWLGMRRTEIKLEDLQ